MAEYTKTLSGGSASSQYRIRMVVTESDVNINNNTSKVNVTAYIDKLKGTGYFSNDGKPWNIKIDGSTVASGNKTYDFRNYTTLTLGSGSKTITHNGDGSKSVAVSAYFNSSPYLGSATVSATFNLTTIARASSISSITGGSELNQSVTVNISRKSNSFTHKVEYSYAGSSYITASTNAGTSCSFTPSISLASYVPNSTSGTLTVRVTTYNGSTQIGSAVTATKTLSVPSSVVPTMGTPSVTRIDNGVPSGWGIYVQSFSKATVTMTGVSGAYGSTIRSYSITGGGLNTNTSSATTGVLTSSGTITFTCTIIDSRGRSATKTASINVAAYSPPSLSLSAERSDSSGTPNASAGTCAKVTATFSFASVSGKNSITSKSCSCNGQTNTSFASGTPFVLNANLSIGSSYTVTASITDALGRSAGPITVSISSAKRIMNIKANKNGMGIGKFAEEDNTLDVAWTGRFRENVRIDGELIVNGNLPLVRRTPPNLPSGVMYYRAYCSEINIDTNVDKYWCMIDSTNAFWIGIQINGAETVTWKKALFDSGLGSTLTLSNWIRTSGATGWYNETYGGGIHMTDSTWIRTYNGKSFYCNGTIAANELRADSSTSYIGHCRFNGEWIGFYGSPANAQNNVSRKGWLGTNGTNELFITAEKGYLQVNSPYGGIGFKIGSRTMYFEGETSGKTPCFRPQGSDDGDIYCGMSYARWRAVYASNGSIQTSDRRLKHDIKVINDRYIELFKALKPITYMMNNGDRVHVGFISQDVEEAMNEAGLTDLDFAGFCKDVKQEDIEIKKKVKTVDKDGNEQEIEVIDRQVKDVLDENGNPEYIYSLRYEEFIALNTRMIQDLMAKVEDQQKIIDEQNKRLETLEAEILAIKDLLMLG